MAVLILLARALYASIFILSGVGHFTRSASMAQYVASKGLPAPRLAVLGTGVLLLLGGLSVLLGFYVQVGALLLILFLVPTAFMMHNFWTLDDAQARQMGQVQFMKDLALAGAAFLIWYLWSVWDVPLSLTP